MENTILSSIGTPLTFYTKFSSNGEIHESNCSAPLPSNTRSQTRQNLKTIAKYEYAFSQHLARINTQTTLNHNCLEPITPKLEIHIVIGSKFKCFPFPLSLFPPFRIVSRPLSTNQTNYLHCPYSLPSTTPRLPLF